MSLIVVSTCPAANGMFTFYRNLRAGLSTHGWEVRCVTTGAQEHADLEPRFVDEGCISLVPKETDPERQRQAFVNWCRHAQPAVVIPMMSEVAIESIPLLPSDIQVVMRCTHSSRRGYEAVTRYGDRTACIITPTPHHRQTLVMNYHVSPEKIVLIESGTSTGAQIVRSEVSANPEGPLRVIYLGRIHHHEKGILDIPPIVRGLQARGVAFSLEIAGVGPDLETLRQELEPFAAQVTILGEMLPKHIPDFLARGDVFLFPSREEGFSNALMEAMGAGCVPVASRLAGITDYIICNEEMGILCPPGDTDAFAEGIATLANNRALLRTMSMAARQQVVTHFSRDAMIRKYVELLRHLEQPGNVVISQATRL